MAAKRLQRDFPDDVQFEFVGISEIEPAAIKAYNADHGPTTNYGDISKIDWEKVPDFDLFTYSFPCQDISLAGRRRGLARGSQTRSSLLWECEKAIAAKRPRYLLMENVKMLASIKNLPDLERWMALLDSYGYCSRWQVINAKDFGVAQNRERVFMVSILRTEADPYPTSYQFPLGSPTNKCVEDYMLPSEEIGMEYFDQKPIADRALNDILGDPRGRLVVLASYNEELKGLHNNIRFKDVAQVCNLKPEARFKNTQTGRVYSPKGISPCVCASRGCCNAPKYFVIEKRPDLPTVWRENPTKHDLREYLKPRIRLRLLHEREAMRLMDVDEADIDKILNATETITLKDGAQKTRKAISKTAAYKLAGNSIPVSCLYHILKQLFIPDPPKQLSLLSDFQNLK